QAFYLLQPVTKDTDAASTQAVQTRSASAPAASTPAASTRPATQTAGNGPDQTHVLKVTLDGTTTRLATLESVALRCEASPDGQWLAILEADRERGCMHLSLLDLRNSTVTRVQENCGFAFAFTPSSRLIFTA